MRESGVREFAWCVLQSVHAPEQGRCQRDVRTERALIDAIVKRRAHSAFAGDSRGISSRGDRSRSGARRTRQVEPHAPRLGCRRTTSAGVPCQLSTARLALHFACRRLRGNTRRPVQVAASLRVVARRLRCISRHLRDPRLGFDPLGLEPAGETGGLRGDRRRLREGTRRLRRISRRLRGDPGGRRRTSRALLGDTSGRRGEPSSRRGDTHRLHRETRPLRGDARRLRGVPRRLRELLGSLAGTSRPLPKSSRRRRGMSRALA
jgi:hypothetical protein